jgi:hypothetical protein
MTIASGQHGRPGPGGRLRAGPIVVAVAVLLGIAVVGVVGIKFGWQPGSAVAPVAQWQDGRAPSPTQDGASSASPDATAGGGEQFTLSAVGDVIMGAAPDALPPGNGAGFFSDVASALHTDLQMANLEQPLTDDTGVGKCPPAAAGKTCFQFRSPPSYAKVLKDAGFALVTLANNHAYDFGPAGHRNTRAALDAAGVKYTGPPGMITNTAVKGIKVAVLGFAPYSWANDLVKIVQAQDLVRRAKAQADIVIIQVHMGGEGADRTHVAPGTETFLGENRGDPIAFSHAVIDAGADIVIGHSPHVMRAMEFHNGHLIAYSLGNFAGYHALGSTGVFGVTGILRVTLRKDGSFVAGTLVPTRMVAPGLPRTDPGKQAISLVSGLTKADFPKTGARLGSDGKIVRPPT